MSTLTRRQHVHDIVEHALHLAAVYHRVDHWTSTGGQVAVVAARQLTAESRLAIHRLHASVHTGLSEVVGWQLRHPANIARQLAGEITIHDLPPLQSRVDEQAVGLMKRMLGVIEYAHADEVAPREIRQELEDIAISLRGVLSQLGSDKPAPTTPPPFASAAFVSPAGQPKNPTKPIPVKKLVSVIGHRLSLTSNSATLRRLQRSSTIRASRDSRKSGVVLDVDQCVVDMQLDIREYIPSKPGVAARKRLHDSN